MQEQQELWVQSLGWKDPLEEGIATHSSTLAWRIPWTGEPGGLQSQGLQRADTAEVTQHAHRERGRAQRAISLNTIQRGDRRA